jgi:CubicO group peptidase (beta-lactamase class C family)
MKQFLSKMAMMVFIVAFVIFVVPTAWAASLSSAKPEQVGLSSERLDRMSQLLKSEIAQGKIPGAVVLIARRGQIAYFESFGFRDKVSEAPMTNDAIFRIYSMTKPFTSVAAMMLVEEGKVVLTDPISKFLPQLGKLDVSMQKFDPATGTVVYSTVSAEREIMVQDLLRHTSGFTYGSQTKNAQVKELYDKVGVDAGDITSADLIERLAKVPLVQQPGMAFEYGRSTDVLGRLIEVVANTTLAKFFEERIFAPLKMTDSGFYVPRENLNRLAQPFLIDPTTRKPITLIDVTNPPKYEAGGQGAVSTASDYARFCQMLLNGGHLDGVRLLSRTIVNLMTADHLGKAIEAAPMPSQLLLGTSGYTFGLGFAIRREAGIAGVPGSVGEYTWGGFAGTYFWIDPKEELIGILMLQAPGPARVQYRKLFRQLTYQAIVD